MSDVISRQAALSAVGASLIGQLAIKGDTAEWREVLKSANEMILELPSAQTEVIRCKNCRWWDKYNEKHGYCMAAKHGFMSSHWEISIYRTYGEDFFCADAELKQKEGRDDE